MSYHYDTDLDTYLDSELGKVALTKRGQPRKRKPKEPRIYFTSDTEEAIIEYLASDDQDFRNRLYKNINFLFLVPKFDRSPLLRNNGHAIQVIGLLFLVINSSPTTQSYLSPNG